MDSHARRTAVAAALASGQQLIGRLTTLGQELQKLWERLPAEYADELQACIEDRIEAAQLIGRLKNRLNDITLARAAA